MASEEMKVTVKIDTEVSDIKYLNSVIKTQLDLAMVELSATDLQIETREMILLYLNHAKLAANQIS